MRTTVRTTMSTCTTTGSWPTARILFALAGTVTLLSAALAASLSPWWLLLTAAVGINQLLYVATGACPASVVISRLRRTTLTDPAEEDTCSSTTMR
ncbi:MAG: hypothetical protein JWN57_2352 [Frankiales bacterium]|jgi:hypothetical protein|nr:hypothetical protein [Frankiales bacterium]